MSIPGYDDWKLMTPEEDRESSGPCPFCGAYSSRSCELEDVSGYCAWEEGEPDLDYLRDLRDEDL